MTTDTHGCHILLEGIILAVFLFRCPGFSMRNPIPHALSSEVTLLRHFFLGASLRMLYQVPFLIPYSGGGWWR
jgi:hypothetical protein